MRLFLSAAFTVTLLLAFCASGPEQALARSKKQSPESVPVPSMAVDDTGTPIIMQGLQPARPAVAGRPRAPKQAKEAERHVHIPHGSPGFIPPISSMGPLPRTPLIGQAPAAAPYNPPPVSNPSAQISQFNQSFQFNRGLGNNPTDRDGYVRYNFNNR